MIELKDITKTFQNGSLKTEVLRGVTLTVNRGEFVSIMGPSGSGKTTLMNILGCMLKPTSGSYLFEGTDVESLNDDQLSEFRNKKIGFVFQSFNLLEGATALDNVLLPLIYADEYPADARERAEHLLASVGLGDRLHYRPAELSGGQRQRVAIARALINEPSVVLADEPTGNLDSDSSKEIMSIFRRLNDEGKTIILITHNAEDAAYADRMLFLKDGKIYTEEVQ
jgi:putative ABC transport system ATP-binding protein